MNLHSIAGMAVQIISPDVLVTVRRSTGWVTQPDGERVPAYTDVPNVPVKVQSLTYSDIQQMDGLNIQGIRRALYLSETVMSIVRAQQRGGDLIVFPAGTVPEGDIWLAAHVLESWPLWRKVAITLQNNS